MKRELICIVCPRGCALTAELSDDGNVISVEGNLCPRGEKYAVTECTDPRRTVTSTMRCKDGEVVAVKTSVAVPKKRIFDVMREINSTSAPDTVEVGQIIIKGVCGLDADVVATANKKSSV